MTIQNKVNDLLVTTIDASAKKAVRGNALRKVLGSALPFAALAVGLMAGTATKVWSAAINGAGGNDNAVVTGDTITNSGGVFTLSKEFGSNAATYTGSGSNVIKTSVGSAANGDITSGTIRLTGNVDLTGTTIQLDVSKLGAGKKDFTLLSFDGTLSGLAPGNIIGIDLINADPNATISAKATVVDNKSILISLSGTGLTKTFSAETNLSSGEYYQALSGKGKINIIGNVLFGGQSNVGSTAATTLESAIEVLPGATFTVGVSGAQGKGAITLDYGASLKPAVDGVEVTSAVSASKVGDSSQLGILDGTDTTGRAKTLKLSGAVTGPFMVKGAVVFAGKVAPTIGAANPAGNSLVLSEGSNVSFAIPGTAGVGTVATPMELQGGATVSGGNGVGYNSKSRSFVAPSATVLTGALVLSNVTGTTGTPTVTGGSVDATYGISSGLTLKSSLVSGNAGLNIKGVVNFAVVDGKYSADPMVTIAGPTSTLIYTGGANALQSVSLTNNGTLDLTQMTPTGADGKNSVKVYSYGSSGPSTIIVGGAKVAAGAAVAKASGYDIVQTVKRHLVQSITVAGIYNFSATTFKFAPVSGGYTANESLLVAILSPGSTNKNVGADGVTVKTVKGSAGNGYNSGTMTGLTFAGTIVEASGSTAGTLRFVVTGTSPTTALLDVGSLGTSGATVAAAGEPNYGVTVVDGNATNLFGKTAVLTFGGASKNADGTTPASPASGSSAVAYRSGSILTGSLTANGATANIVLANGIALAAKTGTAVNTNSVTVKSIIRGGAAGLKLTGDIAGAGSDLLIDQGTVELAGELALVDVTVTGANLILSSKAGKIAASGRMVIGANSTVTYTAANHQSAGTIALAGGTWASTAGNAVKAPATGVAADVKLVDGTSSVITSGAELTITKVVLGSTADGTGTEALNTGKVTIGSATALKTLVRLNADANIGTWTVEKGATLAGIKAATFSSATGAADVRLNGGTLSFGTATTAAAPFSTKIFVAAGESSITNASDTGAKLAASRVDLSGALTGTGTVKLTGGTFYVTNFASFAGTLAAQSATNLALSGMTTTDLSISLADKAILSSSAALTVNGKVNLTGAATLDGTAGGMTLNNLNATKAVNIKGTVNINGANAVGGDVIVLNGTNNTVALGSNYALGGNSTGKLVLGEATNTGAEITVLKDGRATGSTGQLTILRNVTTATNSKFARTIVLNGNSLADTAAAGTTPASIGYTNNDMKLLGTYTAGTNVKTNVTGAVTIAGKATFTDLAINYSGANTGTLELLSVGNTATSFSTFDATGAATPPAAKQVAIVVTPSTRNVITLPKVEATGAITQPKGTLPAPILTIASSAAAGATNTDLSNLSFQIKPIPGGISASSVTGIQLLKWTGKATQLSKLPSSWTTGDGSTLGSLVGKSTAKATTVDKGLVAATNVAFQNFVTAYNGFNGFASTMTTDGVNTGLTLQVLFKSGKTVAADGTVTALVTELTELNLNLVFNSTATAAGKGSAAGSSALIWRPTLGTGGANSTLATTAPSIGLGNGNSWFIANVGTAVVDVTGVALTGKSGTIDINGNKLSIAAPTNTVGSDHTLTLADSATTKGSVTLLATTLTGVSLTNNAVLNVANALSFNTISGTGTFLVDGPTGTTATPASKLTAANGGELKNATFKWKTDETAIAAATGINIATTTSGSFTGTPILVVDNIKASVPSTDAIADSYVSISLTSSGGSRTNDQLTVKSVARSSLTGGTPAVPASGGNTAVPAVIGSQLVGGVLDLTAGGATVDSYNAGQGGLIYFNLTKSNNAVSSTTLTVSPSAANTTLDVTNLQVKFHLPSGTTTLDALFTGSDQAKLHTPDVADGVVLATTGNGAAATSFFSSTSGNIIKTTDSNMMGKAYVVMLNKQVGATGKNQIVLRNLLGDTKLGTSNASQNASSGTGWVNLNGAAVAPSKVVNTMTIIDLANTVFVDGSVAWASVGDGATNVTINGGATALKVKGAYTKATELTSEALNTLDLQGVVTFNHATALTIGSNLTSGASKMHILGGGLILSGSSVNTGTGTVDFVADTSPGKGGIIALTVGAATANTVTIGKIQTDNGGVLNIGRALKGTVPALNSNATIDGTAGTTGSMAVNVFGGSTLNIGDTTVENTSRFGAITNAGTLFFGKVTPAGVMVPVGKIEAASVTNTGTMVVRNNSAAKGGAAATGGASAAGAFVTVGKLTNTGTVDIRGNLSVGTYVGGSVKTPGVLIFNPTLRSDAAITANSTIAKDKFSTSGNGEADVVATGPLTGTPYLKITGTTATSLAGTQVKIRAISGAAATTTIGTANTANTLEFVAIYSAKGFTEKVASNDGLAPTATTAIVRGGTTMTGLTVTGYFDANEANAKPAAATKVSNALIIKIVSAGGATPTPIPVTVATTDKADSDVAKQVASPARLNLALDHGAISGAAEQASTANATFMANARANTDDAGYKISQVMANNAGTTAFDMVFSNSSQKDFNTMIHQFSGSQNLSNFSIAGNLSDMVNDGVTRRLSAIQSGGNQGQMGTPSFNLAKGTNKVADLYGDLASMGLASSSVDNANLGPWVRVAHAGSSLGNTGANNFTGGQDSFQAGFDTKVNKNFTLGFTTAYSDTTSAATGETPTTASFRNLSVGTYGAWSQGRLGIDVQAGMHRGTAKTSRTITPKNEVIAIEEDYAGSAAGSYGFTGLNTAARVGYELGQKSVMSFRPFVGMSYSRTMTDAYTETGSKTAWANLAMPSTSTEKAHATIGIDARKSFKTDAGTVTPRVSLGWKHLVTSAENTETVALAEDQSVKFNTSSNKLDRDAALVGAGVDIRMNDGFAVYGDYNNTIAAGSGHQTQTFIMGGKFGF